MPTVKSPIGPTVQANPLNGQPMSANVPAGAFDRGGAGLIQGGKDIMAASDKMDKILLDQLERDTDTKARNLLLQGADKVRPVLQGALKTQGLNVSGGKDANGQELPDIYEGSKAQMDAIEAELTRDVSPRAKEKFSVLWSSRRENYLNQIFAHKENELVKANKLSAEAVNAELQQEYWAMPSPDNLERIKQESEIHRETLLKGQDESVKKHYREKFISQLHLGAVDGMLRAEQKDPKAIREYVKTYKKEIDPETLNKIEDHLKPQEQAYKADELAQGFYAKLRAGADEAGLMEQMMKIQDIAVRKATISAFNGYSTIFTKQQAEYKQDKILEGLGQVAALPLPDAHKYWAGLPEATKTQRDVKKAVGRQLEAIKQFGGIKNLQTDPEAWAAGLDAVQYAEVKTEKELRSFLASKGPVAEQDIAGILGVLNKSKKTNDSDIMEAYKWSIGQEGQPVVKLTPNQKKEALAFKTWAEAKVNDTNRNDPEFIKGLAKTFQLSGERREGNWYDFPKFGDYGPDRKAGAVAGGMQQIDDPLWVPNLPDGMSATIDSQFAAQPAIKARWLKEAGDDVELARRLAYREFLKREIGPRRREAK